jgi:drug/metabolite transporter (DMT)-like permease
VTNTAAGYGYGLLSALLGACYFVTGTSLVKPATGVSVREFTLALYVWATLFAFAWMLLGPGPRVKLTGRQHGALVLLGCLFGLSVSLAFDAARRMDTASAATLFRTNVFWTLLLGFFVLKERLTGPEIGAGVFVLAGVGVLLRGGGSSEFSAGALSAVGSALLAALYQLGAKKTMTSVPPHVVNAYRNLYVTIVFLVFAVVGGWATPSAGAQAHATIALAALIGPFLHSLANLKSIANLPLVTASLVAQTQPLFVLVLSGIFLGQTPKQFELVADVLVLVGVAGLIVAGSRKPKPAPKA